MAKIILKNVRGSYVYIDKPRENKDGADKYSMQLLIPKDHPQIEDLKAIVDEVAKEKFGKKVKMGSLKIGLRDGDEEKDGDEYQNHYFINASSSVDKKPGLVNGRKKPATESDIEALCYSGAFFHVSVNIYGYTTGGNGITAWLNNVMLVSDGDRLDGSVSAESEFSEFADETPNGDDFDEDDEL